MPLVNVMINGKAYTLGCDEGEEPHLRELAGLVDAKAREALNMVGQQAGDTKLMLMAALLLADEHHDAHFKLGEQMAAGQSENQRAEAVEHQAADALESAAGRLEDIAARLVRA